MTPRQKIIYNIFKPIAEKYQINLDVLFSKKRAPHAMAARDEAFYHLWLHFNRHLSRTAKFVDRHHTIIYSAIGRHLIRQGVTPEQDNHVAYVVGRRARMKQMRHRYNKKNTELDRKQILSTVVEPIMLRHGFLLRDFFKKPKNQKSPHIEARAEAIVALYREVFNNRKTRTAAFISSSVETVERALARAA